MTIGVTGAGGQLGGLVLDSLLAKGVSPKDIVALTRDPAKLSGYAAKGITVRAGDFDKPVELEASLKGVERLLIIPASDLRPGIRTPQHKNAVNAAKAAGVGHVIYISTTGAHRGQDLFASHFATEQAIFASGLAWTILRMGMYYDNLWMGGIAYALSQGVYAATGPAGEGKVARSDVAATAAALLAAKGHDSHIYHATGPASLTPADVAKAIGDVFGKKVDAVTVTQADYNGGLAAAGLPDFVVDAIGGIEAARAKGLLDVVTHDVEHLTGKKALTLTDYLTATKHLATAKAAAH
ncbi:NAD(P)H-binding protein [Dongia rigui]|uniref:NAD(P)H-binding protein n=1 Tax=Dongia rigui TaxID=940149 RepID=A0ABU5DWD0_9PROT|nr:NAD(P)H-binding protein [Dongia rigui]MDY0871611.1 NAD(P)H-binding protein [Dongia rigui]